MKLVQIWKEGAPALGLQTPEGIVDVAAEGARRGLDLPGTMMQAIADGECSFNWGIATIPHPADVEAGYTVGSIT